MNCPFHRIATDYVRRELSPDARAAFESHLEMCGSCRAEVTELNEVLAELIAGSRGIGAPSPELRQRVMAELTPHESIADSRVAGRGGRIAWFAGIAAMLLLSLALGWGYRSPSVDDVELPPTSVALKNARSWLISVQEPRGAWDPTRFGGQAEFEVALTALATLAIAADDRPEMKEYATRAGDYLLGVQQPHGQLGNGSNGLAYNHAIGTLALVELSRTIEDDRFRSAAARAVDRIVTDHRSSVSGWSGQVARNPQEHFWVFEALSRAKSAGISVDAQLVEEASRWLARFEATQVKGRPRSVTPQAMVGNRQSSRSDVYEAYLISRASSAVEDRDRAGRDLVDSQVRGGEHSGSWSFRDRWSAAGGRIYATSLAALTLEGISSGRASL